MLLFAKIFGGLFGLLVVVIAMSELDEALHRKKIIRQVKKQRALQAAQADKDASIFEALEDPQLIELGGPKKALPGDAVADPFRGVE